MLFKKDEGYYGCAMVDYLRARVLNKDECCQYETEDGEEKLTD